MQILNGELVRSDLTKNARGGSELMAERLVASLPQELLKECQIVLSRGTNLLEDRCRIYWAHDLAGDPGAKILENGGWKNFHRLVFVSYWQRQQFMSYYNIPQSATVVIKNGIMPIEPQKKKSKKIKFIYHTTPHRGLNILVPVFEQLAREFDNIHLDVYSSFKIYGWEHMDEQFKPLFNAIEDHPNMTYYGTKSNEEIRKVLPTYDVFAYPCTWPETSCLSLIEAMAAGLVCIHSDLAVLPETSADWNYMYPYNENTTAHANMFLAYARHVLTELNKEDGKKQLQTRATMASDYINSFYHWDTKAMNWRVLLEGAVHEPREIPKTESLGDFIYSR